MYGCRRWEAWKARSERLASSEPQLRMKGSPEGCKAALREVWQRRRARRQEHSLERCEA